MTSMGALFYLLALFLYARGRIAQLMSARESEAGSKYYYYWFAGCLVAGLLALGSKESTAMLPVFIFLFEWYFFQDLDKSWFKRQIKYLVAIVILFGLVAGLYLGFDPLGKFNTLRDYVFKEFTIGERLLTQTRVVIYYLSLIFYPNPSRLNLDYDFPLSYSLFNPFTTFLSLIVIIALIGLGLYLAKKQRLISFCIFWFLGNLVIESSVIPLALIFEHRIYLPSMFVLLLIVILFHRTIKPAWLMVAIACAVVVVCAYWTYERNKIWQDDLVLWIDINKKSPNKARPYLSMGQILTNRHQYDEALPNLLKAVEINPIFVDAHYNLGVLFAKRDEPNKAIEHYRKAVELEPNHVKVNNNLGVVLLKQNLTEEAIIHFQKALKQDPYMAAAHINLGLAFSKQDKLSDAVVHYSKALQISSNLPKAQFQLGDALVKQGRTEQGVHHIKRALQIDPDFAEAHNNLGGQLLQEGKIDEALKHFNAALKTNPDIPEAHNNIGIILIHKGKISEAVFHFQEAVRINPEFELAQDNLRRALAIQQTNLDAETARIQSELKTNPDDPVLNYALGNLYLGKGELNSSIDQYRRAIAIQPDFPQALNNLAMAHTFAGKYDQALEVFQKLITLHPDDAANYYNAAVLYALQKKETEALAWLNKAVEKGYDNWDLIKTDKDLENIRNTPGYQKLIEGH
jgi:tetratricopeptide (TPR) repeat protein